MNVNCMLIGEMHQTNEIYWSECTSGQQQDDNEGNESATRMENSKNSGKYGNEPAQMNTRRSVVITFSGTVFCNTLLSATAS